MPRLEDFDIGIFFADGHLQNCYFSTYLQLAGMLLLLLLLLLKLLLTEELFPVNDRFDFDSMKIFSMFRKDNFIYFYSEKTCDLFGRP